MFVRIILFTLLLFSQRTIAETQEPFLQFGRNEKLLEQDVAEAIFLAVMKNIQLTAQVQALPPARATKYNKNLHLSGEIARTASYGESHPELIQVKPSYYHLTSIVYFKKNSTFNILSIRDLKNLRIGHIYGVQHSFDIVQGLANVQTVSDSKNLFNMLIADRFDAVITTDIDGESMLERLNLVNDVKSTVLGRKDLFVYLNSSSAHLTNKISAEIKRMKKNGAIEKIIEIKRQELLH